MVRQVRIAVVAVASRAILKKLWSISEAIFASVLAAEKAGAKHSELIWEISSSSSRLLTKTTILTVALPLINLESLLATTEAVDLLVAVSIASELWWLC